MYKNIFTAIGCPNKLYSSFKYLNDSIIVTSNGFQTLVGSRDHIIDYEKLYFDILREDTFKIKNWLLCLYKDSSFYSIILKTPTSAKKQAGE
ncbi:hypothetical protein ES708_20198 [subsurface metagenome]